MSQKFKEVCRGVLRRPLQTVTIYAKRIIVLMRNCQRMIANHNQ